jgi:tetratricopeptide (TPR) repeat protein
MVTQRGAAREPEAEPAAEAELEAEGAGRHSEIRGLASPPIATDVFLASRFEEFRDVREHLRRRIEQSRFSSARLTAVDLNDGRASARPVLEECLRCVRRSEFLILMLGESYGELAPGQSKSFTQLEYECAMGPKSETLVLAFGIGASFRDHKLGPWSDPRLGAFVADVASNWRIGCVDREQPPDAIAALIFERLHDALYEKRLGQLIDETDDSLPRELLDKLSGDDFNEESEVASLEEREATGRGIDLVDDRERFANQLDALLRPAAVAALEQREEAQQAIELLDYATAIGHLERALKFRPLDLKSNYWLAQLYVALGRKQLLFEARELAERAARVAQRDGSVFRTAACLVLAARASRKAGDVESGLRYADHAVRVAGGYARARLERARQLVAMQQREPALSEVRQAVRMFPRCLSEIWSDPALRPIKREIEAMVRDHRRQMLAEVKSLLTLEAELQGQPPAAAAAAAMNDEGLQQLLALGRDSIRRQYRWLCEHVREAERKTRALSASAQLAPSGYIALHESTTAAQKDLAQLRIDQESTEHKLTTAAAAAKQAVVKMQLIVAAALALGLTGLLVTDDGLMRWLLLVPLAALAAGLLQQAWAQRADAGRRHKDASHHLDRVLGGEQLLLARIAEQEAAASKLVAEVVSAQFAARAALQRFSKQALRRGLIRAPFASPLAAREGDVVRLRPAELDGLRERIGRRVQLELNLPDWLAPAGDDTDDDAPRLFRVISSSRAVLVLDERAAYFDR